MIILREYKSVVFWLIFVSLWIVGFLPCCNEKKDEKIEKKSTSYDSKENNSYSSELNNFNYNNDNNNNNNNNNNFFKQQDNVTISNSNNTGNYLNDINNIYRINNQSNNNNYQLPLSNTGYYQNMDINRFPNQNPNQNQNFINYIINPQISLKKQEPISTYLKPTLIGLNNIGATCFMNATLQCLSQTEPLSNYFLKEKNKNRIINNNYKLKDPNQLQLSPYYLELIENLWDKKGKISYSPNNFRKIVEQMNPLFKEGQPGDSKDFIVFIIDQMHRELKDIKEIDEPKPNLNQYDKENAFNYFNNDFKNDCSIISETFYGLLENTNICQNCKITFNNQGLNSPICYNYQTFNCLIFPLEEVRKMKNISVDNQNQNQIQNNRVNLYDCFTYYQKDELLTGDNQIHCNICNQLNDSINSSKIYRGPNFLILILNRGRGNIYDVKLDFTETIDITQFILQKDKPQITYNLYGVITHIGQSGPNAHFVASCKSPVDNYWYRYNDPFVNPINDVQKDIIDYETPYILFYERQNL